MLKVKVSVLLALLKNKLEYILTNPFKVVLPVVLTVKLDVKVILPEICPPLANKYLLDKLTPPSCKLVVAVIILALKEPLIFKLLFNPVDVPIPIFPLLEINKWGLVETELLLALRIILQVAWIKKLLA